MRTIAENYYDGGLCVMPVHADSKKPFGNWGQLSKAATRPPFSWHVEADGIAVVCGHVSGGVVCIDFDYGAFDFDRWREKIPSQLYCRLYVEWTQSGGIHVMYKCPSEEVRNMKLTSHFLPVRNGESVTFMGKTHPVDNKGNATFCSIETRGEGGYVVVAPSSWIDDMGNEHAYNAVQGSLDELPILDKEESDILLNACRELDDAYGYQQFEAVVKSEIVSRDAGDIEERPSDYSREHQLGLESLHALGWTDIYKNNEGFLMMARPGQTDPNDVGGAYNIEDDGFFCFTTNGGSLDANRGYTSLQLYAIANCGGDEKEAATIIGSMMDMPESREATEDEIKEFKQYEEKTQETISNDYNMFECSQDADKLVSFVQRALLRLEPMPFPEELLNTGTILDDIAGYINNKNTCEQPVGSMAAALSFVGYLGSRLYKLPFLGMSTSPSMYTLFASPTATGKNAAIVCLQELVQMFADSMQQEDISAKQCYQTSMPASVQAFMRKLSASPRMFLIADEIGQTLQKLTSRNNNINEKAIIDAILPLSTSCFNKSYQMANNVDEVRSGDIPVIPFPALSIYGTGNNNDINTSFNDEMLKKGFVNRLFLFWGNDNPQRRRFVPGMNMSEVSIPSSVQNFIENFAWFIETNLDAERIPQLRVMEWDDDAINLVGTFYNNFTDMQEQVDLSEIQVASIQRTIEKCTTACMVYQLAMQCPTDNIKISRNAAEFAIMLAMYQLGNVLFFSKHFGEIGLTKQVNEMFAYIKSRKGSRCTKSDITRRFQGIPNKLREDMIATLIESNQLESVRLEPDGTRKKPVFIYKVKEC